MIYTLKDLESTFDKNWVGNGSCFLHEHLVAPNVQRGGELLTAVINAGRHRIRVYVKVRRDSRKDVVIEGECSCPARRNCHHVSAVLVKALLDEQELPNGGSRALKGLDRLERRAVPRQDYPPEVRQRLLYVLRLHLNDATKVWVETRCARATPSGTYADDRHYEPAWALRGIPPRFLLRTDLEILKELQRTAETPPALRGTLGERLLRAMLATGRCHLESISGAALGLAASEAVTPIWVLDNLGGQRLSWQRQPVFCLATLWQLDVKKARCVPLETEIPNPLVRELMAMGTVAPERVAQVTNDYGSVIQTSLCLRCKRSPSKIIRRFGRERNCICAARTDRSPTCRSNTRLSKSVGARPL